MLAGCSTTTTFQVPPTSKVVPPVAAPASDLVGRDAVDFISARPAQFIPRAAVEIRAFDFSGTVNDLCSVVAGQGGFGYYRILDPEILEQPNRRSDQDVDAPREIAISWPGGDYEGFALFLSRFSVSIRLVNDVVFCASLVGLDVVLMPRLSVVHLRETLASSFIRAGEFLLLYGSPVSIAADKAMLESLATLPAYSAFDILELPTSVSVPLVIGWLNQAAFSADFKISKRTIIGPGYVVGFVRRMLQIVGDDHCQVLQWKIRGVDVSELVAMLGTFPKDIFCTDASSAGWKQYPRRGLLVARVTAGSARELIAFLERHDPAPRPVVVEGWMLSVATEDNRGLSLAFTDVVGQKFSSIASGFVINRPLSEFTASVTAAWVKSGSSALYQFSVPGLLGDSIKVAQGQSVALSAGALVDDAGTTRESLERVDVGLNCSFVVARRVGGYAVNYSVRISSVAADPSVINNISRSGVIFIPAESSAVLLALKIKAQSNSVQLFGVGRGTANSNIYMLLSVSEGELLK